MKVEELVASVAESFPSFGGNKCSEWNPISMAMKGKPPTFAAGVDIKSVVLFVLERAGIGQN